MRHFTLNSVIQVQTLLINLYGQRHYIYGETIEKSHLCLLEVCNVFHLTQAYCVTGQYK